MISRVNQHQYAPHTESYSDMSLVQVLISCTGKNADPIPMSMGPKLLEVMLATWVAGSVRDSQ